MNAGAVSLLCFTAVPATALWFSVGGPQADSLRLIGQVPLWPEHDRRLLDCHILPHRIAGRPVLVAVYARGEHFGVATLAVIEGVPSRPGRFVRISDSISPAKFLHTDVSPAPFRDDTPDLNDAAKIVVTPDGRRVFLVDGADSLHSAELSTDGKIVRWHRNVGSFEIPIGWALDMTMTPDGRFLAVAGTGSFLDAQRGGFGLYRVRGSRLQRLSIHGEDELFERGTMTAAAVPGSHGSNTRVVTNYMSSYPGRSGIVVIDPSVPKIEHIGNLGGEVACLRCFGPGAPVVALRLGPAGRGTTAVLMNPQLAVLAAHPSPAYLNTLTPIGPRSYAAFSETGVYHMTFSVNGRDMGFQQLYDDQRLSGHYPKGCSAYFRSVVTFRA